MAFQSDRAAHRTYDAVEGWELIVERNAATVTHFRLTKTSGATFQFIADYEGATKLRDGPEGSPSFRNSWHVLFVAPAGDLDESQQRSLIELALQAYGTAHDGPNGPIEVRY